MKDSNREKVEDKIFDEDLSNVSFHNKHLIKFGAKEIVFKNVDFSHTYFEHCYFRKCIFDSCNFNGCKFINCNFIGSSFPGSNFDYAFFDKTIIENEILSNNCSSFDNVTQKFARALRVNYQGLGDAESVNKAIKIELTATKNYLYDAWHSNKTHWRKKYKNWRRVKMFFLWLDFKFEEFIWGNGERLWYLMRTGLFVWLAMTISDVLIFKNSNLLSEYWKSFVKMPGVFFGVDSPVEYSKAYLASIVFCRLIGFALFISIIIKRYNRR